MLYVKSQGQLKHRIFFEIQSCGNYIFFVNMKKDFWLFLGILL